MEQTWILPVFAGLLGAVVGSFLNVCIYRLPRKQSIVSPPSSCPQCGARIPWYLNVPLVSFMVLRGRCCACKTPISLRYPAIELLNGLLFWVIFDRFGMSWLTPVFWLFSAALVVIAFIDLEHQIIPDVISLPGIVVGFLCSFLIPWLSWSDSALGILLGGGSLFVIATGYQLLTGREGMGGGDIKLLAMVGAFMGWKAVLPIIFLASLLGTLVGVPLMLVQRENARLALPFGPFIVCATLVFLLWGGLLFNYYLRLIGYS
ncbi:MAG: prepilin peptidase [Desulfuromonadaceae bacterium]|nr:prepilin peptidase [Desulfuromonadaceae bacterium]